MMFFWQGGPRTPEQILYPSHGCRVRILMCGSGAVMWRIRRGHGSLQRFLHRSVSIGKVCIGTGMQQNCSLWQARVLREMRISKI